MEEHCAYLITHIIKTNPDAVRWTQSTWASMLRKTEDKLNEEANQMVDDNFDEEERCSICLDTIEEDDFSLPCNHTFHKGCIKRWSQKSKACPLCNRIHNIKI
jgi:hypothetical protein